MTGIEQAVIWGAFFAIILPIYFYVTGKFKKSAIGKPTEDEQNASGNTL